MNACITRERLRLAKSPHEVKLIKQEISIADELGNYLIFDKTREAVLEATKRVAFRLTSI